MKQGWERSCALNLKTQFDAILAFCSVSMDPASVP